MKGLIFFNGTFPSGSWPQRVRLTSKGLKINGIENEIIISFFPPLYEEKAESPENVKFMFKPKKKRYYEKNKILYLYYYLIGILKGYNYLRKKKDIDFVIFAQGSFLECFFILKYCKKKKVKFLIDLVDENAKKYENTKSLKDKIAVINRDLYEKFIVKECDYLFVISSYLYDKYASMFPSLKIFNSTPSLVDIEDFESLKNLDISHLFPSNYDLLMSKINRFLYAGSVARPNGIFFFLENLVELNKKLNFEFYLIFIISEGYKNILEKKIYDLNIRDKCYLIGAVSQKFMPSIYHQLADYLFLPEQGDICANAGFPSKTAELLASGKPIISTNFSDISKYLKNEFNSLVSEIGDFNNYQRNLEKLIFNKELCKQLSQNAKETAKNIFDFRIGTKNLVKIIKNNNDIK